MIIKSYGSDKQIKIRRRTYYKLGTEIEVKVVSDLRLD